MAFKLDDDFVAAYKDKEAPWGPVGKVTYLRTYSRPLPDGGQEDWTDTTRRWVEGTYQIQEAHCKSLRLPWSSRKAQRSAREMFDRGWNMKFLPPGRGLWAMGTDITKKLGAAALMNCAFTSTKDIKTDFAGPFSFLMDMSMLGVGVGFDTLGAGTVKIRNPRRGDDIHVVEDSREGWVAIIRRYLDAFGDGATAPLGIDFSQIRAAGTPLKTFGGTAAGSKPLEDCLVDIHVILQPLIGQEITSTAIVDLMNVIGKCVVAGNVRRSAELAIGDIDDAGFLGLKDRSTPESEAAFYDHRWASNNSVAVTVGARYHDAAGRTAQNGEPGYIWLDNARRFGRTGETQYPDPRVLGFNPCVEQPLEDREMCCLVETFPSRCDNYDDYERTLKFAYLYAKSVTLLPTHDERTNTVIMRNRRMGISQSGIVQQFTKVGRREHFRWCDKAYSYLRKLDAVYSEWLCVRESIKLTTVKPSGTVSLLPGVTPGIHYPHSQFYYRTIRFASDSPLVGKLQAAGYRIEPDLYSPNTSVIYFPIKEKWFDRDKDRVTFWEQLENAAQMQRWWSDNGVSVTITFKAEEAGDIERALELYETRLKAVSFLPLTEHGYEQAPYQTIVEASYNKMADSLQPVNWGTDTHEVTDAFCDGEACLIPVRSGP